MQLTSLCFTLLLSNLATGLPMDSTPKNHNLLPRSKTYAVVNVDGGSSTTAPQGTTIIDDQTKTIHITDAASTTTDVSTATDTVTKTVISALTPIATSASSTSSISSSHSSSRSTIPSTSSHVSSTELPSTQASTVSTTTPVSIQTPISTQQSSISTTESEPTPESSLVTVIITEAPAPTQYYDNGFWHTRYPIKTKWD